MQERQATMVRLFLKTQNRILGREEGIAMLTVLMLTIILTVIGIAAITTTSLDLWMAGGERIRESTVASEEACLSSGVAIIGQVLENTTLPAAFLAATANPLIPLYGQPTLGGYPNQTTGAMPAGNPLVEEIMRHYEDTPNRDPDTADPALQLTQPATYRPNAVLTVPGYGTVNMDIDRLYTRHVVGGAAEFSEGINIEILYRISCYAINISNQPVGSLSAVYVCYQRASDRCQRQHI
jgi:type IV pilus assembly PilX-like protein